MKLFFEVILLLFRINHTNKKDSTKCNYMTVKLMWLCNHVALTDILLKLFLFFYFTTGLSISLELIALTCFCLQHFSSVTFIKVEDFLTCQIRLLLMISFHDKLNKCVVSSVGAI